MCQLFSVFCHKWSQNLAGKSLGKMHRLEEQSSTKGMTGSLGDSHTEDLNHWQGPEPGQKTGRAQLAFLCSNTAEGNPFSFRSKTLASWYRTMRGAVPVPAGLVVAPGWRVPGECGTCQVHNAETDAAEVSVQEAGSHTSSLTRNWDSALTEESSRRWDSCVVWKKRCFCLKGKLQCCKVIATAREGNAFPETYLLRAHSISISLIPPKPVSRLARMAVSKDVVMPC